MKKHPSYFFPFPIFHILPILLLTPSLLLASARTISQETMAARIAPGHPPFPCSGRKQLSKDQSLKLGVRDILLSHIQTHAPQKRHQAPTGPLDPPAKKTLTQTAESWLTSQGSPAPVSLTLTKDYFPTKSYGEASFPCGVYDAVRITIGMEKDATGGASSIPVSALPILPQKLFPNPRKRTGRTYGP